MTPFSPSPLHLLELWRKGLRKAKSIHPLLHGLWWILAPPVFFIAQTGFGLAVLIFPSMLLSIGLLLTNQKATPLWIGYASLIIAMWSWAFISEALGLYQQFKSGKFPFEHCFMVLMMLLSFFVISWTTAPLL